MRGISEWAAGAFSTASPRRLGAAQGRVSHDQPGSFSSCCTCSSESLPCVEEFAGGCHLQDYCRDHKAMPPTTVRATATRKAGFYRTDDGFALGTWIYTQRQSYAKKKLPADRVKIFEAVDGWKWNPLTEQWKENFIRVQRWAKLNGHARPPQLTEFEGYNIGTWATGLAHNPTRNSQPRNRSTGRNRTTHATPSTPVPKPSQRPHCSVKYPGFDAHLVLCDRVLFSDLLVSVIPGCTYLCSQLASLASCHACQMSGWRRPRSGTGRPAARAHARTSAVLGSGAAAA
jgi:hypothetical protein